MPGVIAVTALARDGSLASYSLAGPTITVSAFGGEVGSGPNCFDGEFGGADIVTTDLSYPHACERGPMGEDAYATGFGGTSAAAPQVSGVAALILSREPGLTAGEVKSLIASTADPWGDPNTFGYGKLNAYRAVAHLQAAVNGPTYIDTPGTYTWSASASGGVGGYGYQWQEGVNNGSTWYNVGTNSVTSRRSIPSNGNFQLRVIVTSGGLTSTSLAKYITVSLGGCNPRC